MFRLSRGRYKPCLLALNLGHRGLESLAPYCCPMEPKNEVNGEQRREEVLMICVFVRAMLAAVTNKPPNLSGLA